MGNLKIALVADIHTGRTRSTIESSKALPLVKKIIKEANESSVDLFVTLGDNVNSTNAEEDYENLIELRDVASTSRAPVIPLFGNNDLKFLTAQQVGRALNCPAVSEKRVINGWTLLFWRPGCEVSLETGGPTLTADELSWLKNALIEATYPTVVFLHAPIDDHATMGNCYFQSRPDMASYTNGAAARHLIEQSGKVVLVLAGHVHWNASSTIDGVYYKTLGSLVETFQTGGEVPGTWAMLELTPERMTLDVRGKEPMMWSAPPRKAHEHWRRPLTVSDYADRVQTHWQGGQAGTWDDKNGYENGVVLGGARL